MATFYAISLFNVLPKKDSIQLSYELYKVSKFDLNGFHTFGASGVITDFNNKNLLQTKSEKILEL